MNRIMIVDMLNMYYRAYIVDPSLSSNGSPIGGIKGSLKILQKLCRDIKPTQVYICWDGREGSSKRRKVDKNYKAGRKPIRLNRSIRNLTEKEELKNKIWQQMRLAEYFNQLPICQISIDYSEADDIIGALVARFRGTQKVIVSSDKDYFQLLDETTLLLRPTQKQILNRNNILEEYKIRPSNFALARAISGDKSDNLPGVKGVGLKTIAKRVPLLLEKEDCTLSDLFDSAIIDDSFWDKIMAARKTIEKNYKLMNLTAVDLSPQNVRFIKESIANYPLDFNRTEMVKMMVKDGFAAMNWEDLYTSMNRIRIASAK
jgi:5'-3' exonuclease